MSRNKRRADEAELDSISLAEAHQLHGAELLKYFDQCLDGSAGRWFKGVIINVHANLNDINGLVLPGPYFEVEYDDKEVEHLTWQQLRPCLQEMNRRLDDVEGMGAAPYPPDACPATHTPETNIAGLSEHHLQETARAGGSLGDGGVQGRGKKVHSLRYQDGAHLTAELAGHENQPPAAPRQRPTNRAKRSPQDAGLQDPETSEQLQEQEDGHLPGPSQRRRTAPPAHVDKAMALANQISEQLDRVDQLDDAELAGPSTQAQEKIRNEGLPGHIYKLKLENFMCHEHFEMEFGPHVNVISGTNGSGKSAVLQGLQCCLGVSARTTGRATSRTSFIRDAPGIHEARVLVTLWNKGIDAYKPQVFGNKVTVECKMRKCGTTEFKLLDERGVVKDTKKSAVEALLDHLCINAGNPLAVMTQDCSRDFLAGSAGDKKKYKLFMQGTSMEDVLTNLNASQLNLNELLEMLNAMKADLASSKDELKTIKTGLTALKGVDEMRALRDQCDNAVQWVIVEQARRDLALCEHRLTQVLPDAESQYKQTMELAQTKLQQREKEVESAAARLAEAQKRFQDSWEANKNLMESEREARRGVVRLEKDSGIAQEQLDAMNREKEDLQKVLDEGNIERTAPQVEQIRQFQDKAQQTSEAHQKKMEVYKDWRKKFEDANSSMNATKDQWEQKVDERRRCEQELERLRGDHHRLSSSQNDRLFRFGGQTAHEIKRLIDQHESSFHYRPVGPLGMLLNLTVEEMWGPAVEASIGRLLEAYVCHDSHDANQLRRLFQQVRARNVVYTIGFNFPQHNIPAHRQPSGQFLTVLRALTCNDPSKQAVVMNILVDQAHAESTVLVNSIEAARDIMYKRIAGDTVSTVYEANCTLWSRQGTAVNSYPARNKRTMVRLGSDDSSQLRQLEELIQQQQGELHTLRQQEQALEGQYKQLKQQNDYTYEKQKQAFLESTRFGTQLTQLQTQIEQLSQAMAEVDPDAASNELVCRLADLATAVPQTQVTLNNLRSELAEATQRLEELEQLNQSRRENLDELVEAEKRCRVQLTDAETKKHTWLAEVQKVQARLDQTAREMEDARQKLEFYKAQEEKYVARAAEICDEAQGLAALQAMRGHFTKKFQTLVQRRRQEFAGNTPEEMEALQTAYLEKHMQIEKLKAESASCSSMIHEAERQAGGNVADLERREVEVQDTVNRKNADTCKVAGIYSKLKVNLDQRFKKLHLKREAMAEAINQKFKGYMSRKNHTGKIIFQAPEEKLILEVCVNGKTDVNAKEVRDLKQLSGGERSFTTVSFILALAQFTDTPFRCMDEYDVFMDAINRRIATETLLQFALETLHLQYIFLTPQDLQAVEEAKKNLVRKKGRLPEGFLRFLTMPNARPGR